MSNELTNINAAVLAEMPDHLRNKTTSRGSESVTATDITIPRLDLVQALSPCLKEDDAAFIKDAKVGMLFNSVTREVYGRTAKFVPVTVVKQFNIWKDRKAGGGFKGSFESAAMAEEAKKSIVAETGDNAKMYDIVETAVHYGLLIRNDGTIAEISIPMSKSKMKVSRKLNSLVRMAGGDRWDRVYEVKAVNDKSDLGEYVNFDFVWAGYPTEAVSKRAEEIYELVKSGKATASFENHEDSAPANVADAENSDF